MSWRVVEQVHELVGRPGHMRPLMREDRLPERLGEGVAYVPEGAVLALEGRLESVHEGILATVDVACEMRAECSRCLTEFTSELQVDLTELFAYNASEADEYAVQSDQIDLAPPLRDAVVLALPFQPVCRPDCYGLDPESGEKRAAAAAPATEGAIDPRWAALARFQAEEKRDA